MAVSLAPTGQPDTATRRAARLLVGAVSVLPVAGDLDLDGGLTCDRRPGDLW